MRKEKQRQIAEAETEAETETETETETVLAVLFGFLLLPVLWLAPPTSSFIPVVPSIEDWRFSFEPLLNFWFGYFPSAPQNRFNPLCSMTKSLKWYWRLEGNMSQMMKFPLGMALSGFTYESHSKSCPVEMCLKWLWQYSTVNGPFSII